MYTHTHTHTHTHTSWTVIIQPEKEGNPAISDRLDKAK